jgi:N-acetylmuramoyl-L-alanine amidase
MDPAAIAGLCAVLAHGRLTGPLPDGVVCPPPAAASPAPASPETISFLAQALNAPAARDGISRVAFAEAGNQGDSGLAAVVYAILNRLADGRWGTSVDAVLNARSQFEPVMRAGGDWRGLPAVSAAQQARIDTILNLALDGRLPDLTGGARFFQNPAIVARRARDGEVSPRLVNFGGATPSAVIGAHAFYVDAGRAGGSGGRPQPTLSSPRADGIFVGENRAGGESPGPSPTTPTPPAPQGSTRTVDASQALFVDRSGQIADAQP